MKKRIQNKILLMIFIFAVIVGCSVAFVTYQPQLPKGETAAPTVSVPKTSTDNPYKATLEGEVICLPHADTSGPQTLECAFGLKTDDGANYALDAGVGSVPPYKTGDRIRVNGTVTPKEMLSAEQWQKYDIKGICSITDSVEVL